MTKLFIAALSLLFCLSSAAEYNFYVFASEWAGTVCIENQCGQATGINQTWFNIHGLWPSDYNNNELPAYCTNSEFNIKDLSSQTQSDLITFWSGLYSSADEFHSHEWSKHGTCWNDTIGSNDQQDFFSTVITVAKKVDVYTTLINAGITPRVQPYNLSTIQQAFRSKYGVVGIQCNNSMIQEVDVCLDLNYNFIDCPSTNNSTNCLSMVVFPPLKIKADEEIYEVSFEWTDLSLSDEIIF